jgi:hypothetical protein
MPKERKSKKKAKTERDFIAKVEDDLNALASGLLTPGVRERARELVAASGLFVFNADGSIDQKKNWDEEVDWAEFGKKMKAILRGGQN